MNTAMADSSDWQCFITSTGSRGRGIRHAHGDWHSSYLGGWREKLSSNAIRPSELFDIEMRKDGTAMYIKDARA